MSAQFSSYALLVLVGIVGCGPGTQTAETPVFTTDVDPAIETAHKQPVAPTAVEPAPTLEATRIVAEDLPLPEGAKPFYTADTSSIVYHMPGDVATEARFHTDSLSRLGWTRKPTSEVEEDVAFIDFQKGNLGITVTVTTRGDRVSTVIQGTGVFVSEALDKAQFDE